MARIRWQVPRRGLGKLAASYLCGLTSGGLAYGHASLVIGGTTGRDHPGTLDDSAAVQLAPSTPGVRRIDSRLRVRQ